MYLPTLYYIMYTNIYNYVLVINVKIQLNCFHKNRVIYIMVPIGYCYNIIL